MTMRSPWVALLAVALGVALASGILVRGYWTPDEPREADIAWRMSWQPDKAVPLLAGEAFCEKPPLAYWVAGTAIAALGREAWEARLPNLLYGLITALAVASIGRRSAGALAGFASAAAISTFLLSYQVTIWLATDAPLVAAVSVALLGLYIGFYATSSRERLRGYSCMHTALALGFLCKSAAGWMVPILTLLALVVWEKRWRELLRWELHVGVLIQAALILTWVAFVYRGADGAAHLKVFFWNNLVGRFARVDAPAELQYAGAHRNSPGKYLLELPSYLWPWTLLVLAAVTRAYRDRGTAHDDRRLVRFAFATFVPTLAVLSSAATARNIYLAPALPGLALLLGWWAATVSKSPAEWDVRAVRVTAALLLLATAVMTAALVIVARDAGDNLSAPAAYVTVSLAGMAACSAGAVAAWRAAADGRLARAVFGLVLAYCALLAGPASQIYRGVNGWQDLAAVGRAIGRDSAGRPLILFAADETTRAFVDMYAATAVQFIPGPVTSASTRALQSRLRDEPRSWVVAQIPGRAQSPTLHDLAERFAIGRGTPKRDGPAPGFPDWAASSRLQLAYFYSLPNGRRYALLEPARDAAASGR